MAKQNGIYKCNICGNVVSVIEAHQGGLVCCGQPMELLKEKISAEEGKEKHVPIIEQTEKGAVVKVGSVPHPMEEEHHIELIQVIKDRKIIAEARLNPGNKPEAEFCLENTEGISARELCNVHGLWTSD